MAENNLWAQHGLSRLCFGLDMDNSLRGIHKDFPVLQSSSEASHDRCDVTLSAALPRRGQDHTPRRVLVSGGVNPRCVVGGAVISKASLSQTPFFSDSYLSSQTLLPHPEEDQVVPSAQKGPSSTGHNHHQHETKPLPPLPDSEELMSDEAADNEVEFFTSDRRSLLPKPYPKVLCKGSNVNTNNTTNGQINYAYQERSLSDGDTGNLAFSWPGCEDRLGARSSNFRDNSWENGDAFWNKPEQNLPPKMRFSCSVPPIPQDKPEVPPRIPMKPKYLTFSNEDKPPKIPPRVPLVPPCPPRTPSPKSLPIYINGVMPATQSFAANPNYVSKNPQRHHSERVTNPAQSSPCIVPILKDGRQASNTHYILLPPGRPANANRRDRLQSEPTRKSNGGFWKKL